MKTAKLPDAAFVFKMAVQKILNLGDQQDMISHAVEYNMLSVAKQVEIGGPDVIPNSCDLFTWECVAARWEN